tara:strand:- start:9380 stop:10633 length:1254 start_codon:yes stop_codon:yes gene_type:complete
MAKVDHHDDLPALAMHLRTELHELRYVLLYAYNGIGKTRLSRDFSEIGKIYNLDREPVMADTLYFNAFTEDLFTWDNDLEYDERRILKLNTRSRFFVGLAEFEIENRVRSILNHFADFGIKIDLKYEDPSADDEKPFLKEGFVSFNREILIEENGQSRSETIEDIKISRGEESIFVWCFFMAIVEIVLDPDMDSYDWVKYIYIDDPISSLDEQNAIKVATHLALTIKQAHKNHAAGKHEDCPPGIVISTHHPLFHNVLWNEFNNDQKKERAQRLFLSRDWNTGEYLTRNTKDTPFFHHIANLMELYERVEAGNLDTYHFNSLRVVVEKTSNFLGYNTFSDCIKRQMDDYDGVLHARMLNLLSHGGYSLYEPFKMGEDNIQLFKKILHAFIQDYAFSEQHFPGLPATKQQENNEATST